MAWHYTKEKGGVILDFREHPQKNSDSVAGAVVSHTNVPLECHCDM